MWNLWNPIENKFTWVIRNFPSLKSKKIYSDEFVLDGCTWRLLAFPKGNGFDEEFSLYLDVAGGEFLPSGWRRHARMMFTIVNQVSEELSVTKDALHFFNAKESDFGFKAMMPLKKIHDKDGGFLVNGKLKIVVGVQVLGVTGERDMPDASEDEAAESSDDESDEEVSSVMENINGFLVLPSQVETVRRIFEKHPETTTDFRPKNQHLRSSCISVLLALIETLCQSTRELSKGDLEDADSAFGYLVSTGLNLDWLEDKLVEVTGKKESVEAGETRMQKIEKELKELRQKCSNLEFKLEEEKANVALARAPLSFDDVV